MYEARGPNATQVSSGVVLTPNGLRVLDHLGVFERIRHKCWTAEYRTYKNDKDETTRKVLVANEELYGYRNHRIWRTLLLDEMKAMLQERKVPVLYNARFEGITVDAQDGIKFLMNGMSECTKMLIGADGIYSTVRKYIDPMTAPEYTGTMAVLAHIDGASIRWPYPEYERQCTIQGKPGAMFMIPEDPNGVEIMVGKQSQHPDQSNAEWAAMVADKDRLCAYYREGYAEWGDMARQIIDAVCANKETLYLWPFMRMPKLERWFSDTGRVLLVGDAAHALPPSSGQGVNQALEDVYSFTRLLKSGHSDIREALKSWQEARQARIDAVFNWATNAQNVQRLPEAERNRVIQEGKAKNPNVLAAFDDMRWLYQPNLDQDDSL